MKITELTNILSKICEIYVEKFKIEETDDWYLLKLQEEVGEVISAHLKLSGRARLGDLTKLELEKNLEDEIADVLAFILLFARRKGIDPEEAIKNKWFKYLEK